MKVSKSSIFTLAHKLYAAGLFTSFSESLKCAWGQAKADTIQTIEFVKKSTGKITKRVVSKNITKYYTPKGAGKPQPKGLIRFVDLFKLLSGEAHFIISTYSKNILNIA